MIFTDNFVGEAELPLMNESIVTQGRHILPLTGLSSTTYGSLTVEVLPSFCLLSYLLCYMYVSVF